MAAIYNSNGKIPIFYTNFALELIEGCPTLLDGEELRNIGIILKAIVMNTYANQSKDAASNVTSRLMNVLDNGIVHDALYEIYVRLKGTQSTLIDFRDLESIRKWGPGEFSQMMDTKFGLGENSGGDVR